MSGKPVVMAFCFSLLSLSSVSGQGRIPTTDILNKKIKVETQNAVITGRLSSVHNGYWWIEEDVRVSVQDIQSVSVENQKRFRKTRGFILGTVMGAGTGYLIGRRFSFDNYYISKKRQTLITTSVLGGVGGIAGIILAAKTKKDWQVVPFVSSTGLQISFRF